MKVLGDLWRAPHSDQSRYNMPRKFPERESPILGRRTPPRAAISSIASVLEPSSPPSPPPKRRKANSPPRRPLPLTRLPLNHVVGDSQDPYNPTEYYRHSGEHSTYLPPSPPSNTQYSSHTPPHPAPLLTQAYPSPGGGMYMPHPSQPVSMHDRSPFSPSIHGGLETF